MKRMKELKAGDVVRIGCLCYKISKIFYQFYAGDNRDADWGWLCEFEDANGRYHYWKQYLDGGEVVTD